ncbi:MAG: hypothetical protein GX811_03785 [Lentisphaerae bacterium]|jgi:hypothetical protein|nr:hypothetical protein [Lentisphaerota bacterium]
MTTIVKIGLGILKILLLGMLFLGCFALTIPVVVLTSKMFPAAPPIVHFLPVIPLMVLANRYVISPIEFYLKIKSFQYDSWFERRRDRKIKYNKSGGMERTDADDRT